MKTSKKSVGMFSDRYLDDCSHYTLNCDLLVCEKIEN